MKDPVYRLLRCNVQALIDRDAPHASVLIDVSWNGAGKTVAIVRDDLDGTYIVWNIGFVAAGHRPDSLDHGRYGIDLETAAHEQTFRLHGQ